MAATTEDFFCPSYHAIAHKPDGDGLAQSSSGRTGWGQHTYTQRAISRSSRGKPPRGRHLTSRRGLAFPPRHDGGWTNTRKSTASLIAAQTNRRPFLSRRARAHPSCSVDPTLLFSWFLGRSLHCPGHPARSKTRQLSPAGGKGGRVVMDPLEMALCRCVRMDISL